jgi:hypothetical protein
MHDRKEGAAASYGAKGGKARAEKLTREERRAIARKAAEARWIREGKQPVPQALRAAPLSIAGIEFECAVLDDKENTRVVSETRFMAAMGMYRSGALSTRRVHQDGQAVVPLSLAYKNLQPYVAKHLESMQFEPLSYRTPEGALVTVGLPAAVIPKICEVWIDADREGKLGPRQKQIAAKADMLLRGFAHVGIIALIDEATGFQDSRPQLALAKILEQFVAREFRKWTRTFPLEYFRELCRLKRVPFPTEPPFRLPQYFGHLTNDLVYDRLAPGVLAELRRKNPTVAPGQRRHKHFQWLTENVGDPRLREHLWKVIGIMQVFEEWDPFYAALDRILPRFSKRPLLAIIEREGTAPVLHSSPSSNDATPA